MIIDDAARVRLDVILEQVVLHGWVVLATRDDAGPFAYTVGLTLRALPELLVEDLADPRDAQSLLNEVAEAQVTRGRPFRDGEHFAPPSFQVPVVRLTERLDLARLVVARHLVADVPHPLRALTVEVSP